VPDNPDQRLQEDVNLFTTQTIDLSMGFLNAVVTLVSFVGILWSLSGGFSFALGGHQFTIPGFMVWMAVLYCVVGSVLTHYIGRPLIGLNFEQQRREADYRHHLMRVREYSEAIALDKGEQAEYRSLDLRFSAVLANYLKLIRKQKQLVGFTNVFGQAAVVFPMLLAAPRFFSGAIQLGELMQISSAFDRVQGALSWFVDRYDSLASWRATTERLTSFEAALSKSNVPPAQVQPAPAATNIAAIQADDLSLQLPGGTPLVQHAQLHAAAGQHTLRHTSTPIPGREPLRSGGDSAKQGSQWLKSSRRYSSAVHFALSGTVYVPGLAAMGSAVVWRS
jgi:putative ATP-binding cassette transporter